MFRIYDRPLSHLELETKRWDPRLTHDENLFFQLELSREELARLLPKLRGRPTFYEHMDNHPDYEPLPMMHRYGIKRESWGYIVRAEQDGTTGSVYVYVKAFDTLGGQSMASKLKQRSGIKGCSLQHTRDMIQNQVWANEVSSCREGKRPKTFYLGTATLGREEDLNPPPTPTFSSEVQGFDGKADLNDLPYVLKRSAVFASRLPPGLAFRGLEDFCAPGSRASKLHKSVSGKSNLSGRALRRETHPPLVFSKASKFRRTRRDQLPCIMPGGSSPIDPNPLLKEQFSFLLASPFSYTQAATPTMSVNAKASLRVPAASNPSLPSTAALTTAKATSNNIAVSNNALAAGAAVDAHQPHPVVDAQAPAPPAPGKPLAPITHPAALAPEAGDAVEVVPVNNAASETSPAGTGSQDGEDGSAPNATVTESTENTTVSPEGVLTDLEGDLVDNLGAEAWESLSPEQRPKVQAMLNALQSRHLKASHGLRKELATKDQEIQKWRAQKAAQEKKTMDDFMGAVLKVVSQTTGPETQACLQQALEDLNQRSGVTIAEKASAFLPFVAQAQIMTAKAGRQVPGKQPASQVSKASVRSAGRPQPTSRVKTNAVGLDIAANRSFSLHRVNPKSSRSAAGSGGVVTKKKKLNTGEAQPSSLGFVFSSALKDPSTNHRYGKFTFD